MSAPNGNTEGRRYSECYWCGARRLAKNLRRTELAGPARRRVWRCCEERCPRVVRNWEQGR